MKWTLKLERVDEAGNLQSTVVSLIEPPELACLRPLHWRMEFCGILARKSTKRRAGIIRWSCLSVYQNDARCRVAILDEARQIERTFRLRNYREALTFAQ